MAGSLLRAWAIGLHLWIACHPVDKRADAKARARCGLCCGGAGCRLRRSGALLRLVRRTRHSGLQTGQGFGRRRAGCSGARCDKFTCIRINRCWNSARLQRGLRTICRRRQIIGMRRFLLWLGILIFVMPIKQAWRFNLLCCRALLLRLGLRRRCCHRCG